MEKLFHFDSPTEPYQSDAAVIYCFDDRITLAVQKFLKRRGLTRADIIRVAGGPKALASPGDESERAFLLQQLWLSQKLHGTSRLLLFSHSDCGTYGGLAAFGGDPAAEVSHHHAELARAVSVVNLAMPDLTIECLFVDFCGVWRLEAAELLRPACRPAAAAQF